MRLDYSSISKTLNNKRQTLLGVGPMSLNCVNAILEISYEIPNPLFVIPSRRQIDNSENGGGYVNNWSTHEFSQYIKSKDKKNNLILCRDHGGPWQGNKELNEKYSLERAMKSAKKSFEEDIDSGFQILHIDPSVHFKTPPSQDEIIDRALDLIEHCTKYAEKKSKNIQFEVGTEEQVSNISPLKDVIDMVSKLINKTKKLNLPKPLFVVVQTGTKVLETKNVGSFDNPVRIPSELPPEINIPKIIQISNDMGFLIKQHNSDYLSDGALKWTPKLGIHAVNVAPEFGVAETKGLINYLDEKNSKNLKEEFIKIVVESKKWIKWLEKNSKANDLDKTLIAGHYTFSTDKFLDLYAKICSLDKNFNLEDYLKLCVKKSILRYINHFRLNK